MKYLLPVFLCIITACAAEPTSDYAQSYTQPTTGEVYYPGYGKLDFSDAYYRKWSEY